MAEHDAEMEARQELMLTFQNLAPLFQSRPLDEDRLAKKHRGPNPPSPSTWSSAPSDEEPKLLHLLTRLVLRQEQEIQSIRAQDTYIIHMSVEKGSLLQLMMEQGTEWSQQKEKECPLRVHLFRSMAQEAQKRFMVVMQAPQQSETWKQLVAKRIILQDGSWPTLEWQHSTQKYELAKKAAIKMTTMQSLVAELVELGTEPHRIQRFFSMQQQTEQRTTVAWRLQLHLRSQSAHELMENLVNSTLWVLLGAMMKQHRPGSSALTQQVSAFLGKPNKGKGKGKSGGKMKQNKAP